MKEEEFAKTQKKIEELTEQGRTDEALHAVNEALDEANRKLVAILTRRARISLMLGNNAKEEEEKNRQFQDARQDIYFVLRVSKDIRERIAAINLLILIGGENAGEAFEMGMRELEMSNLEMQQKNNSKADLMNSFALHICKTNLMRAITMFLEAYEIVEKKTLTAGHLMQNVGTCYLKMYEARGKRDDYGYLLKAISYYKLALDEYPKEEKQIREMARSELENAQKELSEKRKSN